MVPRVALALWQTLYIIKNADKSSGLLTGINACWQCQVPLLPLHPFHVFIALVIWDDGAISVESET